MIETISWSEVWKYYKERDKSGQDHPRNYHILKIVTYVLHTILKIVHTNKSMDEFSFLVIDANIVIFDTKLSLHLFPFFYIVGFL